MLQTILLQLLVGLPKATSHLAHQIWWRIVSHSKDHSILNCLGSTPCDMPKRQSFFLVTDKLLCVLHLTLHFKQHCWCTISIPIQCLLLSRYIKIIDGCNHCWLWVDVSACTHAHWWPDQGQILHFHVQAEVNQQMSNKFPSKAQMPSTRMENGLTSALLSPPLKVVLDNELTLLQGWLLTRFCAGHWQSSS